MSEQSIFFLALGGFIGLSLGVVLGSVCSAGIDWFGPVVVGPMIGAFAATALILGVVVKRHVIA